MARLLRALVRLVTDLNKLQVERALVGGVALGIHAEPRTTRDVDVVVLIESEADADRLVTALLDRGYARADFMAEDVVTGALAMVRLWYPPDVARGIAVDLGFRQSGIEREIVKSAVVRNLTPDLRAPVVRAGHLLALKILAGRPQDLADAAALFEAVDSGELQRARQALELISRRGYDRGRDLMAGYKKLVRRVESQDDSSARR